MLLFSFLEKLFSYIAWDAYLFILFFTSMKEDIYDYSFSLNNYVSFLLCRLSKQVKIIIIKISNFLFPKELKNTFCDRMMVV